MDRVPVVDYLVLDEKPHLITQECTAREARFFDRRNACGAADFRPVAVSTTGVLHTFTIVHFAADGVPVPYVAGIVDSPGRRSTGRSSTPRRIPST